MLNFLRRFQRFPETAASFTFTSPPAVYEGSDSSTFSSMPLVICLLIMAILVDVTWDLIGDLICISLMANNMGAAFHVLAIVYLLFGEMSILILCPYLNWIFCLTVAEWQELFTYSGYQTLSR